MTDIQNMQQAEEALSRYEQPEVAVAYTLDSIVHLMEYLGNPQDDIRVIHIAGTSGKTSTSYFTAALLGAAGYSVGLMVSPHIDTVKERTQINLEVLSDEEYCELLGTFLKIVEKSDIKVSYFEVLVAFSYWVFAKKKLDYAVIEVGLGGLLDGTNVVTRDDKISVITDIGYDHTQILGNTLTEIATQKAGIILQRNAVYMYEQGDEVMTVVRKRVDELSGTTLHVVDVDTTINMHGLPLFQQRNFNLAYQVAKSLHADLSDTVIDKAQQAYIPARMEIVHTSGKTIIMDGAHNGQKIGTLVESLKEKFPDAKMTILLSFGAKRTDSMVQGLKSFHEISDDVIATTFETHQDSRQQSLDTAVIADQAREVGFSHVQEIQDGRAALEAALSTANEYVLVTGSFYLLATLRPYILAA